MIKRAATIWSITASGRAMTMLMWAALMVRLLVPSGYMLHADAPLSLNVRICGAIGEEDMTIPVERDTPSRPEKPEPCPFMVTAVPINLPPTIIWPDLFAPVSKELSRDENAPVPGRGLAAPPPPATGPPLNF